MLRFRINVYSNSFKVTVMAYQDREIIKTFSKDLNVYEKVYNPKTRKNQWMIDFSYSTYDPVTTTYGFHGNMYASFINFLNHYNIHKDDIEIFNHAPSEGDKIYLVPADSFKFKSHQPDIVDFILKNSISVIPLQTGQGKTVVGLASIYKNGIRTAIIMDGGLVTVWIEDAKMVFGDNFEDLNVIRGSKPFMVLIDNAKNGVMPKSLVLFTVKTMGDYLADYEKNGVSSYGCNPEDLYALLGIGYRISDEAHANLHFQFRHDILTNVKKSTYLSATIESNRADKNRVYEIIFPKLNRYTGLEWKCYIAVNVIFYKMKSLSNFKFIGGRGYSHVIFEQSIMKDKNKLNNYLEMINSLTISRFINKELPNQKLLIYASTTDMCDAIANHLGKRLPVNFRINSFTGTSEDDILPNSDIIVTTPGKCGRGTNIKKLTTVITTVAIDSTETNLQSVGRLRELHEVWPEIKPEYIILTCLDIKKHRDYHNNRIVILRPKVDRINIYRSNFII